ncbi:hypothetical protein Tco_1565014 [Tanacetum coccineum]
MQVKKPDLSFFHVFGALCYPTNDNDDLDKLDAKSDNAMASEQFSSGPGLQCLTPATSSSRLVPNPDAPSLSTPLKQEQEQFPTISQGFEELPKTPIFRNDPLNESPHEESISQGSSSNVRQTDTLFEHIGKWTKNHPIANVIGDPSCSVSTRKQL